MKLTRENYHSLEAARHFMSKSQFDDFLECEARIMAELNGEWEEETTQAMLRGSYVHAWNEGKMEEFELEHPEMFKRDGNLKAEFLHARVMVETLESDPFAMHTLSNGEKESILTGNLFGVPWKVMIDVRCRGKRNIDLKTTKGIREYTWSEEHHAKISFLEQYHYLRQAAIYSEVERIDDGRPPGDWLPFYAVVVSSEKVPDKEVIEFTDADRFDYELSIVEGKMPRILAVKSGEEGPIRCNRCGYCKSSKLLSGAIHFSEI